MIEFRVLRKRCRGRVIQAPETVVAGLISGRLRPLSRAAAMVTLVDCDSREKVVITL